MDLSNFVIRLVFLGLPGIVASQLFQKLRGRRDRQAWEHFLEITLFALVSYGIYDWFATLLGPLSWGKWLLVPSENASHTPLRAILDEGIPISSISWRQVLIPSTLGVGAALAASYIDTHKWITRLGRGLNVTKRFGDEDVWEFFHNMSGIEWWVFVRDHKLDVIYYGWVVAYSDSDKERELLLKNVDVFSAVAPGDAARLYTCQVLYVCRDKSDISIEIPSLQGGKRQRAIVEPEVGDG